MATPWSASRRDHSASRFLRRLFHGVRLFRGGRNPGAYRSVIQDAVAGRLPLLANGAIFWNPNTGKPWKDEQVQRRFWAPSLRRCGLRHREQYQTRHTFATMCLMNGANPAWVARQMGHKSLKMFFEVYARWIDRADKGLEKARMDAATITKSQPRPTRAIKPS